jgi:hypothetical protein
MRTILPLLFCSVLICGCIESQIDTDVDAKAEIKTEVEAYMNTHLESLIKAEVNTKVQGVGVDLQGKIADTLKNEIKNELQTDIDALISSSTQNTGMFSGGAIYILIAFVVFVAFLFGTIIYFVKQAATWKNVWSQVSTVIERHGNHELHKETIKNLKSQISTSLEVSGLKDHVDHNLKKRGLRKKK